MPPGLISNRRKGQTMADPAASSPHDIRSFSTLVTSLEDGALHAEITDEMKTLIADLQNHAAENGGKPKGKLVLTIDLKFADGVFDVQSDFKITAPKTTRRRTVLWSTPDNNLSRANPRQQELPLRTIDMGSSTIKAV
jgi:hypothetical protein